jgi:hypothetical protein
MNHDKASLAGSLADQMKVLIDEAINLEVVSSWYYDEDPQYGGPPSMDQLMSTAMNLRAAYMKVALITGFDPCEQLPSTKQHLKRIREKFDNINFDD